MRKIKQLTADKVLKIQEASKVTIGHPSNALQIEILQLIETIQHYTIQIDQIQAQINEIMAQIDSPILSITGIRERLGAVILAEIKSIENFTSPAQLQAFAGLGPSIY